MESLIYYLLIAVAMGLDAFSVSLSLGIQQLSIRRMFLFSLIVGIFHYLFPLMGESIGHLFKNYLIFPVDVTAILFIVIGIYMMIAAFGEKKNVFLRGKPFAIVLLGLAVSIDSLSIGFSLSFTAILTYWHFILFGSMAMVLTFAGIYIGRKIRLVARIYSEFIAGAILLFIGCTYLII